jgi:hypothetical protein
MKYPRSIDTEIKVNVVDISPVGKYNGEDCFGATLDTGQLIWVTESWVLVHPMKIVDYTLDELDMAMRRMIEKHGG